ncbi:MAG TPA: tryptophan--tRNA ligase [Puia sp.]|nr:tryptophan--tRNA ligase [Puia sp.]
MEKKKEIVMSGIRPTGFLHLGNYFGAVRNYVRMQENYQCFFMVADWHALTTMLETKGLQGHVRRVMAENIASGLDPEKVALYCQSHVPETAELYLLLNMLAYKGELEKTPTFKEKVRLQPQNVNAGLLTYPVLMAADILLHRARLVPVGKDQEQHLEIARNFADRFNSRYGDVFPDPYAFNFGEQLVKVPSLDGAGKMSKSENQNATIYLADSDDIIRSKIRAAKTATGGGARSENAEPASGSEAGMPATGGVRAGMTPPVANLFLLLELVASSDVVSKFEADYTAGTIRYSDMKGELAEGMVKFIAPIREKAIAIQRDEPYLNRVMEQGADKARASADETLKLVRQAIGLKYY